MEFISCQELKTRKQIVLKICFIQFTSKSRVWITRKRSQGSAKIYKSIKVSSYKI